MPFTFENAELSGVIEITQKAFSDDRGYFAETFKMSDFSRHGIDYDFVQDNHSYSVKGVVRGLHFQKKPQEQGKLVSVISGAIFDVAVDLRDNSVTFGKWYGTDLTEENHKMLWIPPGFAHGFQALEDSHVTYKVTSEFCMELDSGIRWDDPDIAVEWPMEPGGISDKDSSLQSLEEYLKEGGD